MSPGVKTYEGSCHCGFFKYKVDLDLTSSDPQTLTKCNCTICQKINALTISPKDRATFKVISPKEGEKGLVEYTMTTKTAHRYHCPTCGVQCFGAGVYEMGDKKVEFTHIYANTLDKAEDGSEFDLRKLKVQYWDGLNDNFAKEGDKPFLGGVA